MKNNRATWVFLGVLFACLIASIFRMRELFGSAAYPLIVFVLALYTALSFFEWVNKKESTSSWFRLPIIGNCLAAFRGGELVSFWHKQFIFWGGFGLGWAWLIYFG